MAGHSSKPITKLVRDLLDTCRVVFVTTCVVVDKNKYYGRP